MRAEAYWRQALARTAEAQACGALVPLRTELVQLAGLEPFLLRRLLSRTPKHLRAAGPKPNPFLPWERELEVGRLGEDHVLLLNKFPVQPGHLLVISRTWQPQAGWLEASDWHAVSQVAADCGGLWFFNSCAAAGASQPHRHLQLLPRHCGERSCPLASLLEGQLAGERAAPRWPWCYALSARRDPEDPGELASLYLQHADALGLGAPARDPQPRHPYNLLFDDHWLLTVRRRQEHCAGFSLNALAFAGYLLATESSRMDWLEEQGPWQLLRMAATERRPELP